jgi:hypothetical protein
MTHGNADQALELLLAGAVHCDEHDLARDEVDGSSEHASSDGEEETGAASHGEKIVAVLARQRAAGDQHEKERKEVMLIHTERVICDAHSRTLALEFNALAGVPPCVLPLEQGCCQ